MGNKRKITQTIEHQKLKDHKAFRANWKKWGPYLAERAWGTVREDLSEDGSAWESFPHEQARSRAYRWNEDGLLGICDRNQNLCFCLALWNGQDPILKERLFGLSNKEGNHGEDVKEYYYYLDSSPTHSYMKALYKYPQGRFPYSELIEENAKRGYRDPEYELLDTGILSDYFDVFVEYGKADENTILIQVMIINRGTKSADFTLLPNLWFRNTWSWGYPEGPMGDCPGKPQMVLTDHVEISHPDLGEAHFYAENPQEWLFTENETSGSYPKDAFHRYVIEGEKGAINPAQVGTKCAPFFHGNLKPGESKSYRMVLTPTPQSDPFATFEKTLMKRKEECDQFYDAIQTPTLTKEEKQIQRQAFAEMLFSKQLYYYDLDQWIHSLSPCCLHGRNHAWENLVAFDVISMPDKWEYPWFACWDLAFHTLPLAIVDPDFAKRQLVLMTREWYMHTNGQLPAYEWNFSDVNPPVHAWATWRVYKIEGKERDREFLEGIFHKLLLNFTWWVNRKDAEGNNLFQGGFLGLDNISIFDRSALMPEHGMIDQSDGTAWMGFYCVVMMRIALELAKEDPIYQDSATKFFEHFLRIAHAMVSTRGKGVSLWDEEDGFFYDAYVLPDGTRIPLKIRSSVGLIPLLAVETLEPNMLEEMSVFNRRLNWFIHKRPEISCDTACIFHPGKNGRRMFSFLTRERLVSLLHYMLDEKEFLSDYGIRSLSKIYENNPYSLVIEGKTYSIDYEPAESTTGMFGGNSNWRGPIWFPLNYLFIESLQKYHHYYGDTLKVPFPTGSSNLLTLGEIATALSDRLIRLFLPDKKGKRPIYGDNATLQSDPHWKDHLHFNEYFHGDTGLGLGANHQTGWTGLIAKLLQQN